MPASTRREFLKTAGVAIAATTFTGAAAMADEAQSDMDAGRHIYKSLKWGMIKHDGSVLEKFELLKELGYDGVEVDSPGGVDKKEALAASEKTGVPIEGAVCSTHWSVRMSDPNAATREQATKNFLRAIEDIHYCGGSSVLLVPGHGQDGPADVVEKRAIEQIKRCLPLASKLGVHILIENVWNHMLYDHDGGGDQSAERIAKFVDACDSPWVGVQFDIGNHIKYGPPAQWIRTLGKRIVKLDMKDFKISGGFCDIGDGDANWPDVRKALKQIGFSGWAAAEVGGGGRDRLATVLAQMNKTLGKSQAPLKA